MKHVTTRDGATVGFEVVGSGDAAPSVLSTHPSSCLDDRALRRHRFDPTEFASLAIPVTFLCGSESPPIQLAATNELVAALPDATRIDLVGQGHEGTFSDPEGLIEAVVRASDV